MATFVLLPAAWCGGWVWGRVTPILRSAGHDVHAVTFTGLGDRSHLTMLEIGVETHILDVVSALEFEGLERVILVGWSYGGMIAAAVADRLTESIERVVFLDSPVPLDGQSSYDTYPGGREVRKSHKFRSKNAGTPGWLPFNSAGLEAQVPDRVDREWCSPRFTPHPLATLSQPVQLSDSTLPGVEKIYIQCLDGVDPAEPDAPFVARSKSEAGWKYFSLDANHMAPISAYRKLADLLLECVPQARS